jgi:hypothetical protein
MNGAPRNAQQNGESYCRNDRPQHLGTAWRLWDRVTVSRQFTGAEGGAKNGELGDYAKRGRDPEDRFRERM